MNFDVQDIACSDDLTGTRFSYVDGWRPCPLATDFHSWQYNENGKFCREYTTGREQTGINFFTTMLEMPQPDIHALKWSAILPLALLSRNGHQLTVLSSH
ncbi:hypothetical protein Spb1_14350 [Planctopirus ephydatiae]|uniref:Uncharacterized protein n=1 Tax=Planctopirus ephydatiae TaxID=2528019 RepID=A0A518GLT3_9PLAN|nr:hypothetical protein Spb1_14350 [Planctopirus ephydatiae]